MPFDLESIVAQSREILKALKGEAPADKSEEKKDNPPVPEPPAAEDRTDPRVEGASPTEGDIQAAKDGQDAGAAADPDALPEGGEGAGEGEGGGEFDEHGHHDMDPREIKKAFPSLGHLFPEEGVEHLLEHETAPGSALKGLEELMAAFKGFTDALAKITAEINEIKKGKEIEGRELKKALDDMIALRAEDAAKLTDLQARLDAIHVTAPAAGEPRAIAKALPTVAAPEATQTFTNDQLNALAASQKLGSHEISLLCVTRQQN